MSHNRLDAKGRTFELQNIMPQMALCEYLTPAEFRGKRFMWDRQVMKESSVRLTKRILARVPQPGLSDQGESNV